MQYILVTLFHHQTHQLSLVTPLLHLPNPCFLWFVNNPRPISDTHIHMGMGPSKGSWVNCQQPRLQEIDFLPQWKKTVIAFRPSVWSWVISCIHTWILRAWFLCTSFVGNHTMFFHFCVFHPWHTHLQQSIMTEDHSSDRTLSHFDFYVWESFILISIVAGSVVTFIYYHWFTSW